MNQTIRNPVQPAALRARYGLSQAEFARLLGISVRTLQQWEQGTRKPTGPALTLLRVVADHPEVFDLSCNRDAMSEMIDRDITRPMHSPPHPGEVIRDLCIEPLNLTVTQAAAHLGVSRKALSELLNGHSGISADMAIRLSRAFGRSAPSWLLLQAQYDLAQALKENEHPEIQPIPWEHAAAEAD
jgi:addiction module HigA family antidote